MSPNDVGDSLTCPLVPSAGQNVQSACEMQCVNFFKWTGTKFCTDCHDFLDNVFQCP